MNEVDKKRLEEMQAEARTVPLSEKERWLIDQLEAEAAEVERLMVLATRYNDERITAELEAERLRGENKRQFRQIQDLCNTGFALQKRLTVAEGREKEKK